jgi:hypothetical protein
VPPIKRLLPLALLLILLAIPADASAALQRCSVPEGFTTGPFFVDQVKKRGMSCRTARRQVKRWGNTRACVYPDGPRDRVCRAGGYRCVSRDIRGFEGSRISCRARGRAVGFRIGV